MSFLDWLSEGITDNLGYFAEYLGQFDNTWEISMPQLAGATAIGTVLGGAITALFF